MSEVTRERVAEVLSRSYGALTNSAILDILDELFPAEPSPRTWSIPAEPEGVERVRDERDIVWSYVPDRAQWEAPSYKPMTWHQLLLDRGPLTEVVESEVEAAARRLREYGLANQQSIGWDPRAYEDNAEDMRIVLAHVLNGGTL